MNSPTATKAPITTQILTYKQGTASHKFQTTEVKLNLWTSILLHDHVQHCYRRDLSNEIIAHLQRSELIGSEVITVQVIETQAWPGYSLRHQAACAVEIFGQRNDTPQSCIHTHTHIEAKVARNLLAKVCFGLLLQDQWKVNSWIGKEKFNTFITAKKIQWDSLAGLAQMFVLHKFKVLT